MGRATTTPSTAMGCTTAEMALTSSTAVSKADPKGLISKNSFPRYLVPLKLVCYCHYMDRYG